MAEHHPSGATEQEEVVLTGAKTKPGWRSKGDFSFSCNQGNTADPVGSIAIIQPLQVKN